MQFLPATTAEQVLDEITPAVKKLSSAKDGSRTGFKDLLSSFIEEDRLDYSGRPAGAPAQEENSGTLSNSRIDLLKNALRKRNVPEENILGLDNYVQNGAPLTVARAFSILSGERGRLTESLGDEERASFSFLLGKMGFSKDQTEEMIALADDGKGKELLRELREGIQKLEGKVDASREELSAMLKGLDMPRQRLDGILQALGNKTDLSLNAEELETLLAGAGKEFALRDKNDLLTKAQMRSAMNEALGAAKAREQAAPVDDNRGSRRSEQLESFMHDSVLKNTGADRIKRDFGGNDEAFERDGRDHAWRSPQAEAHVRARDKSGGREKSVDSAASKLLQRFDVGYSAAAMEAHAAQARNLDTIASKYNREIFSQVENGILHSAKNGAGRISLQLMPEELGRLTIMLSMHRGELKATITADNPESAAILSDQMAELKASLEEQGLKVSELEVQTGLQDNRFAEQWSDHREHNLMSDSQERDRLLRLSRLRREQSGEEGAASAQERANYILETGLHIVA